MDTSNVNKKYPKSKHGQSCVGPCYYPGTYSVHPLYLKQIKANTAYCPTVTYTDSDDKSPKILDECNVPTHTENQQPVNMNSLSPIIEFNNDLFLRVYYDIYSLEDAVKWISDNNYMPISNLNRILNLALKVHGKNIEIVDNRIIDYVHKIFKHNIETIVDKALKYVEVTNKEVKLVKSPSNPNEDTDKKIKYIETVFLNSDILYKFIIRYVNARKTEWDNIDNHVSRMINDFADYIEKKIKVTLKI